MLVQKVVPITLGKSGIQEKAAVIRKATPTKTY
jgi:hypothetical protein